MIVNVFAARCITNLHVGNGDVNYNIVDQEVEKDPVTGLPMINASGVKGAIKEFFESKWGKYDKEKAKTDNNIEKLGKIFGTGDKEIDPQGSYKFLQADILFRPLRVSDEGEKSYVLTTTNEILEDLSKKIEGLSGKEVNLRHEECDQSVEIEGEDKPTSLNKATGVLSGFIAKSFAITDSIEKYDLPVIARNVLDDKGISKNLWYEEFVPHESIFGLIILTPEDMDDEFKRLLTSEPVQFGGNASIGYGLMDIKEVNL